MGLDESIGHSETAADWVVARRQGAACAQRGELAKARDFIGDALDLYRASGATDELIGLYAELGDVYLELGHLDEAIGCFKQTLTISRERHDGRAVAGAHRRLGIAYQERGDFERAEESYREADRLLDTQGDQGERALLHLHWGSLLQDLARYKKAREKYEMALGILAGPRFSVHRG